MQARCESQGMLQSFPLGSCLGSGSAFDFDGSSLSRGCTKSSWSSRSHGLQLGPRTSTIFRKDASSCPLSTMNCARGPRQSSTRSRKCCRLLLLRLPSSSGATVSPANPETLHSLNSRSLQINKSYNPTFPATAILHSLTHTCSCSKKKRHHLVAPPRTYSNAKRIGYLLSWLGRLTHINTQTSECVSCNTLKMRWLWGGWHVHT